MRRTYAPSIIASKAACIPSNVYQFLALVSCKEVGSLTKAPTRANPRILISIRKNLPRRPNSLQLVKEECLRDKTVMNQFSVG